MTESAERRPVHRTVIQVEVFSADQPYTYRGLEQLAYDLNDGPATIGDTTVIGTEPVPADEIVGHLLRIGNDGTFFDDPDDEWG